MPKFRILLVGDVDDLRIADEITVQELSKKRGEEITLDALAELGGKIVSFDMHTPTWERMQQATARALTTSPDRGFEQDAQAFTVAKVSLLIKQWPKDLAPFVPEGVASLLESTDPDEIGAAYKRFPVALCTEISALIDRKTHPSLSEHPDFSELWSGKPQSSGAKSK